MKTIGLVGGMTWHSTVDYYRLINQGIQAKLGGSHSARIIMLSVDFEEIETAQTAGEWPLLDALMSDAALKVEAAGAEAVLLCANTMHKTAEAVQGALAVPLIHIVDATAAAVRKQGLKSVGLLGTRYTMEQDFYRARLEKKHGLQVLIPELAERDFVHNVIYKELGLGRIEPVSRSGYIMIIENLRKRGAEGIILGCTEIPLLIGQDDSPIPVFDTTALHAGAAVEFALRD